MQLRWKYKHTRLWWDFKIVIIQSHHPVIVKYQSETYNIICILLLLCVYMCVSVSVGMLIYCSIAFLLLLLFISYVHKWIAGEIPLHKLRFIKTILLHTINFLFFHFHLNYITLRDTISTYFRVSLFESFLSSFFFQFNTRRSSSWRPFRNSKSIHWLRGKRLFKRNNLL